MRRKLIAGIMFGLLVLALPALAQGVDPREIGGRVVFMSTRDGHENLYVLDLTTSQTRQLTFFPDATGIVGVDTARWSPDGRKIAFAGRTALDGTSWEIYLIDPVTSADPELTNIRQVTSCPGSRFAYLPDWDPIDPNILFYMRADPYPSEVYRLDLGTNELRRIPNSSGSNNYNYCLTPDGDRILFSRSDGGWSTALMFTGYQDMFGSGEEILLPTDGIPEWVGDINPVDEWILYYEDAGGGLRLYKMDKLGHNRVFLGRFSSSGGNLWPVWTTGGNDGPVIFECSSFGNREIVAMLANGSSSEGRLTNLTNNPAVDRFPDWTPTGWNSAPVAAAKDLSLPADGGCVGLAAALDFDNGSSDPDGDEITFSVAPAGPYPLGVTDVVLTVTDSNGASATAPARINVYDETPPVPDLPALPTLTGQCSVQVTSAPTAMDACAGGIVGRTADPLAYAAQGTYTINWVYEDAYGNISTQTQMVIVSDTIAPTIQSVSATPSVLWPPNHQMVPVMVTVGASDSCGGPVTSRITMVTSNEDENGLGDGDMAPDWEYIGPLAVNLRAERSGLGEGRIYTLHIESKDAAGNVARTTVAVTVAKSKGR